MIPFVKMSGSGNDFVVIDNRKLNIVVTASWIKKVCHRRFGVGADGVLMIENSQSADFEMKTFNSDGSECEMCGNGARCIARYAYLKGIASSKMQFETLVGLVEAEIINKKVKVKLLDPKDSKLNLRINSHCVHFVNMGVPHTVLFTEEIDKIDVIKLGRELRFHSYFSTGFFEQPKGTNVNFVEVVNNTQLKVRTYERGVENETLACGTGSAASVCIAAMLGKVNSPVDVITKGGEIIKVYFNKEEARIKNLYIEGNVDIIFEGKLLFS
jgi:diaminopimelate epimerase